MTSHLSVFLLALVVGIVSGKLVIPFLHKIKFGQSIREEGPESHHKKKGTPTMGGVIFFIIFIISTLIYGIEASDMWFLVLVSIAFGLVGFSDDYLIIKKKANEGLTVRFKFILLTLISLVSVFVYLEVLGYPSTLSFGRTSFMVDLGYGYYVFGLLLLTGTTNAVNITDGVDGLSSSVTAIASIFFIIYAWVYQLNDVLIFSIVLLAATLAFLFFNWYPAKVFMGDTGSLFLGGAVAALAMVTKTELLLPIVGMVYVIETLSVILQVFSFKVFGKRIIKMSPLHHHFELTGWSEEKIVLSFSAFGLLCLTIAILII